MLYCKCSRTGKICGVWIEVGHSFVYTSGHCRRWRSRMEVKIMAGSLFVHCKIADFYALTAEKWLIVSLPNFVTIRSTHFSISSEMCSERDSPLEPFVLPAPGQPELAQLTCGAHLGPPVLTRKQKRPRVNSLVCDRAAVFCAAGPPEALSWMSRLVTQAAKRERELARAHSQRLKQATLSLPGESVSRGFADRGALEGYPSHYTSLISCKIFSWIRSTKLKIHAIEFCDFIKDSVSPSGLFVPCSLTVTNTWRPRLTAHCPIGERH